MQKFVVKKISRSTNVTIGAAEQSIAADQVKPQRPEDLEISSVKMSGYLKKKRNVSLCWFNWRNSSQIQARYWNYDSGKLRSVAIHAFHGTNCKWTLSPLFFYWANLIVAADLCLVISSESADGQNYTSSFRIICWCHTTQRKSTKNSSCRSKVGSGIQ